MVGAGNNYNDSNNNNSIPSTPHQPTHLMFDFFSTFGIVPATLCDLERKGGLKARQP